MSHHSPDPYASTGLLIGDTEDQSFVNVAENDSPGSVMELPKEDDGSLLLSTVTGQFPNAVGLKYKGSSGAWRGIRISGNVLDPPAGGWGNTLYYVTLQKSEGKRKLDDADTEDVKDVKLRKQQEKLLEDIIVLGLPFKCTNELLKDYFTNECGELAYHEVKFDRNTGKSRGFGFIRFKTIEGAENALNTKHTMMGRTLEIRLSKKKEVPLKLFVGRIPSAVTQDELQTYFSKFGEISDLYMPTPMRGFAFVTFESAEDGNLVVRKDHKLQGSRLNVVVADPQGDPRKRDNDDARDEGFARENRGSGDHRRGRELDESGNGRGLHGHDRREVSDHRDRGFFDIGADREPRTVRDSRLPRDSRESRIPREPRAREPRDDREPRESRDSRIPREPRAREPRDDRVPREPRDSRVPREPRLQRNTSDDRPRRESRGDRYQRDGDNRGPRDFRDPIERNPMERRNVDFSKEEVGSTSLNRGHGERNGHQKSVQEDFRDIIKRNRTEQMEGARDPRDRVKMESRENNVEMDRNRDGRFAEDRRRNVYEVPGSSGMVGQGYPHGQYQLSNQFTGDNKFHAHTPQHMQPNSHLPRVTPEVAVRLKDMIYKILGATN